MTLPPPQRADRSAAVKARIRESATRMFAETGFANTGVRDIAAAAGVDPAIVIRHFASKEALFLETVVFPESWRSALSGPIEHLGRNLVHIVAQQRDSGLAVWAALIRASDRPDVGTQFKQGVTELFANSIVEKLDGADAQLRAHLFAAQFEGLLNALAIREDPVLLGLPPDQLESVYGQILQATLTPSNTTPVRSSTKSAVISSCVESR